MTDIYGFRGGPSYRPMTSESLITSAMEQPLSPARTLLEAGKGGVLESFGLGTAIRDVLVPAGRDEGGSLASEVVREAVGNVAIPLPGAYRILRSAVQSQINPDEPGMSEDEWKRSAHFRENVPWDASMTQTRAQALAEWDDAKRTRQFFASKRPITAFIGFIAGQALDPINYIPVAGPAVKAAAVARSGRIAGTAVTGAIDAAANTAIFGMATRETRRRYGDDVSWQTTVSEIATAALIGSAFGGIAGAMEGRTAARLAAEAQTRLGTLKTTQEARVALNEAIDAVVRGESLDLSPNTVDPARRVSREIDLGDPQSRAEAIGRIVEQDVPLPPAPRKQLSLTRFLASEGGIVDEGGKLAAMGLSRKFVPGSGALVTKRGRALDYAREAAAEAGYFDHIYGDPESAVTKSTPNDLLRLLDQEQRGEPVFSSRVDGDRAFEAADYDMALRYQDQYRRIVEEVDSAIDELGLTDRIDEDILRSAARYAGQDGLDPINALERAIDEDYRSFASAMDERGEGFSDDPDFDIPFFADTGTGSQAGGTAGAPRGDGGQGGRIADEARGLQPSRTRIPEREARAVDITPARREPPPEGLSKAASRVGTPEDVRSLAEQFRVNAETGDFPELAEIEQLRAEGRLSPEDDADLTEAQETFENAGAYAEALQSVTRCLL